MANATCQECGTSFDARRKDSRYCSRTCGSRASRKRNPRGCDVEGCDNSHGARGMCHSHYATWHRQQYGRNRNADYFPIVCIVCGSSHMASRRESKFCSDACKGQHYSETMRSKSKLPADHPVVLLIAEARKPKLKPTPLETRTPRECPSCAGWFSPLYRSAGHMTYCTDRCAKRASRLRRRAREHNTLNNWTWSDFIRVARKFNYCCAYCGTKPERLDPDHVVPLSRGGADAISNLLPVCLSCNSDKCARLLHEWAVWRAERGKPAVVTSWAMGDDRFSHLTDALLADAREQPVISPAA